MSPLTRRQALRGGGASLLAALAGCTGSDSSTQSVSTPHGPRPETLVTDYDLLTVRAESDGPIFREADSEDSDSFDSFLLTSDEDRRALDVVAEPDGIDVARRFLDRTSFDGQALVVVQRPIDACHDVELLYVSAPADRFVDLEFCRVLRDADVACSVDDRHVVASLVRLPYSAADRDATGWSHGGGTDCRLPPSLRNQTAEEDA